MKQLSANSYQLSVTRFRKEFYTALIFLITVNCLLINVKAQTDEPANLAPPPIKIISKEEKIALAARPSNRARVSCGLWHS